MHLLLAALLSAAAVFGCTLLHYEGIRRLDAYARARRAYPTLYAVITALIALHLAEIGVFAVLLALADGPLALGGFTGVGRMDPMDDFYFAAEAYASLGYGDIAPTGELRLLAAIAPLAGLLLLAWSGAFLFSLVQDWRNRDRGG